MHFSQISQEKVAAQFSSKFNLKQLIARNSISNILRNRQIIENSEKHQMARKKERLPTYPVLEECLMLWYSDLISHNIPLSYDMFIAIAKEFGPNIGISDMEFSYSKGWLEKFKTSNIIFQRTINGEAARVDIEFIKENLV